MHFISRAMPMYCIKDNDRKLELKGNMQVSFCMHLVLKGIEQIHLGVNFKKFKAHC